VLRDFNRFVRRSRAAVEGATGGEPPAQLSAAQIAGISESVSNPNFDVYVGKEDGLVRRVSGRVEFEVPADLRARLGDIKSGTLEFSLELADVNGDQEIEAPAKARPLSALTRSLGGASALDSIGSGIAGDGEGSQDGLGESSPEITPPDNGEGGGGQLPPESTTTPEAEDFKEYAECLDEARPEDTDALQRCSELLRP
jgi:hypothetical protein